MAHRIWKNWLESYAEGTLRWPFARMVESHTRSCLECRRELSQQVWLLQEVDSLLFSREETIRTAVAAVQGELRSQTSAPLRQRHSIILMFAGAAVIVTLLALIPPRLSSWLTPGVGTVSASSSWGESTATTVAVAQVGLGGKGSFLTNSSGVGKGMGVGFPDRAAEEWGG